MTRSPLQLEHYFIAEAYCEAPAEAPGDDADLFGPADRDHFNTDVHMYQGESEKDVYQIQLLIQSREDAESFLRYKIKIHIVGFFRVNPDFTHDHLEHLIQVNGASVLYSAARDFVLTLTSRGPWGPLMLPTINFRIGNKNKNETLTSKDQE